MSDVISNEKRIITDVLTHLNSIVTEKTALKHP